MNATEVLSRHHAADVALIEFRRVVGTVAEPAAWAQYVAARDLAAKAGGSQ